MRNIQNKLLKVPHFILKSSVNFQELYFVNFRKSSSKVE